MKTYFKTLTIIPLLVFALASCGTQPQSAQSSEGADAQALVPAWQNGAPDEISSLPDDLLTDDQKDLFEAAWRMYDGIGGCSPGYAPDYSTKIEVPQEKYDWDLVYALDTGFATYEDFTTALHAVFTDDYCDELLACGGEAPGLIERDGKLWSLEADRGSNIEYMYVTYSLVSSSDTEIVFNMTGHYAPLDGNGEWIKAQEYTQDYPIKIEKTSGGWRFASFAIPY